MFFKKVLYYSFQTDSWHPLTNIGRKNNHFMYLTVYTDTLKKGMVLFYMPLSMHA